MSIYQFQIVFYKTITQLHIGCGQDIGLVDNPIIREKTTQFPYIPGSGIRGVLRDRLDDDENLCNILFGPEATAGEDVDHAGCLSIHDAKILFFPVRSDKDLFHWVISPYIIKRFNEDLEFFKCREQRFADINAISSLKDNEYYATDGHDYNDLFLEEFPFRKVFQKTEVLGDEKTTDNFFKNWLNKNLFQIDSKKTLIISDKAFGYFTRNATMVMQHNRLTSAKTVESGALFSVEAVPPETYFYGIVGGTKSRDDKESIHEGKKAVEILLEKIKAEGNPYAILQLGGNESTGLGVTQLYWNDKEERKE